jgi:RNA polymerase sigma factor (sigma-70 family)
MVDIGRPGLGAVVELDRQEFTAVVERYNDDLLRLAFAMAGERTLAEDAVQGCWQAAWQARGGSARPRDIRRWLIAVTANEVRRRLRRERVRSLLQGRLTPSPAFDQGDPEHIDLARGLAGLSTSDRQLVAMRYDLDMTSDEIGAVLGLSGPGVRRRLQRTLTKLRTELGDD